MATFFTRFDTMYNSEGQRAWKDGINGRTYYIYDGGEPVVEINSNGGAINAFGPAGLVARYTSNPSAVVGESFSTWQIYYTFDPQGNVAQRVMGWADTFGGDGSGTGVANATLIPGNLLPLDTEYFDAFGQKRWDIDLFTGQAERYQDPSFN